MVWLLVLVAALAAGFGLVVAGEKRSARLSSTLPSGGGGGSGGHHKSSASGGGRERGTCAVCDLRDAWLDHVYWTREVSLLATQGASAEATQPAVERLLRNQTDIANWFARQLSESSDAKVIESLLITHIKQAVELVTALVQKAPQATVNEIDSRWQQNAREIAAAFYDIGQKHGFPWTLDTLSTLMLQHLDLLQQQITAFLQHDFDAASQAFDAGKDHILLLSQALVAPFHLPCCSAA